jgi:hypothetical protein
MTLISSNDDFEKLLAMPNCIEAIETVTCPEFFGPRKTGKF